MWSGIVWFLLLDEPIKTYGAYWHFQWGPARRLRDMCSHSIAGPHLPPAPFIKWICHIFEARKVPGWVPPPFELNGLNTIRGDVSKMAQFKLYVKCFTMCYCLFFVTGGQALKHNIYIIFYFASVILAILLSHHRWLEVLTMFPV